MSAVCVLTPVVIGSWPVIQTAIAGAITALGFSMSHKAEEPARVATRGRVEEPIANSEVLEEHMAAGEKVVATKGKLRVEIGRDERGACSVCVSGEGYSDRQLRTIGQQIAGKVVQQYTYHKVVTELQARRFNVADEQVAADGTIKLHVRRAGR